jgi:hypothetical protein
MLPYMDKSECHNHLFYENYILGRLSIEEENLFEEHLLTCHYCQKELKTIEKAMYEIRHSSPEDIFSTKARGLTQKFLLGIAASILIIVSTGIYFLTKNSRDQIKQTPVAVESDTIYKPSKQEVMLLTEEHRANTKKTKQEEYINPDKYKLLPEFENAIKNSTRSGSIEVTSPKNSAHYHLEDTIVFDWESNIDNLILVIFSNKGEIIYEQAVNTPFYFTDTLGLGLYYWQIEDINESYFTDKFTINQ